MSPTPSLPDIGLADVGRTFVMRPGSQRVLVLDRAAPAPTVVGDDGVVEVDSEGAGSPAGPRRLRLQAVGSGRVTIRSGDAEWHVEVRRATGPPEQTRDDTDQGWGDGDAGRSQRWWEEQRPPHW
ncbi:hypothetical protein GA707_12635 [Nostocoides sp. F2B08]|uniref:hypothetical protein n=1 Tax=Nostocoides sp. F2B08 TaxID=2653936 RepID=UPI0012630FA9|nr:hypothetical protein [Tetrasphaera sp. F2B08]KAB7743464.1 hypothetical protein GA707_12635 [Tetrasphaera sp. F2B08]